MSNDLSQDHKRGITILLYALEARGLRRGLASVCIGGGESLALIVERPS